MSVFKNIYKTKLDDYYKSLKQDDRQQKFFIFQEFYSTATGTYTWSNLPKNTLVYQPEEFLFWWGQMAFFKEDDDFKLFPCFPAGTLLENGLYDKWNIIAPNGKNWIKDYSDIEICFANNLRVPTYLSTQEMVDKCNYALKAVDTALKRAIAPNVFSCADEKTMKMLTDYLSDENSLPLFKMAFNEGFNKEQLKLFKMFDNKENDILALWDVYVRYRNMFLSSRGISNVEIQKKERLTEAEGGANDEFVRYSMLDSEFDLRKDFINRVKKHFDYELTCELNRDRQTVYELTLSNEDKTEAMEMENLKGVNLGNNQSLGESDNENNA